MTCSICGGGSLTKVAFGRDLNSKTTREVFTLLECKFCKTISLADPPADMSRFYVGDYFQRPKSADDLKSVFEFEKPKLDLAQQFQQRGSILEIGSGYGAFCYLAKMAGYDVTAIEADAECCDFISRELKIPAVHSTDPARELNNGPNYDIITMWNVIEHLHDPVSIVTAVASSLKPGGTFIVMAPNPDAWQAKVMGRWWPHWDIPRHLHILRSSKLSEICAKAGLRELMTTTRHSLVDNLNRVGWALLFKRASRASMGIRLHGWLRPIEMREGNGAAYISVFTRPSN
jgi:2-polyprenyl-3-methyl-5-hydroxy-6-metoxy-1,4-benzoquinol methylase